MGFPILSVEIAFTSDPFGALVWTAVTDRVISLSIRRGRNDELGRVAAGTAVIALDNDDHRYSPTHEDGPYYPLVRPMRPVRVRATWAAVTYDLYRGLVASWPESHRPGSMRVEIRCVDGFAALSAAALYASYPQEASGTRVERVLDAVGWPAADRALAAGDTLVQAVTLTGTSALDHILAVAEAENGLFWVDGAGRAVWQNRRARDVAPYTVSQVTLADDPGPGELGYAAPLETEYGDAAIYNEVRYTRAGGSLQVAADLDSQGAYLRRTLDRSGLLLTTDAETLDAASWRLAQARYPRLRIPRVTVESGDDAAWPHLLGRELSERVTIRYTPAMIQADYHLEGVEHRYGPGQVWRTTWSLSPVSAIPAWLLGVTGRSELGVSTVLGY